MTEEYIKGDRLILKKSEVASIYTWTESKGNCGYRRDCYYLKVVYKNGVVETYNIKECEVDLFIEGLAK